MHTGGYPPYSAPVRDPECRFVAAAATLDVLLLLASSDRKEKFDLAPGPASWWPVFVDSEAPRDFG